MQRSLAHSRRLKTSNSPLRYSVFVGKVNQCGKQNQSDFAGNHSAEYFGHGTTLLPVGAVQTAESKVWYHQSAAYLENHGGVV